MPLAQDQFRQLTHKIHAPQFSLRKEALKKFLNGDPKDLWHIDISEDEKLASGNDSEVEKDKNAYCNKSDFKWNEDRHYVDEDVRKEWQDESGRYEWRQNGGGECRESECSDDDREDGRYCYENYGGDRSRGFEEARTGEHRCHTCECCQPHGKIQPRTVHGCDMRGFADKTWRRNSKEESERRMPPKSKSCRRVCSEHGRDCSEYVPNRTKQANGLDCQDKHRCNEWSSRCQLERTQKIPVHMLMYSKPFKNVHHARRNKNSEEQIYRNTSKTECCHRSKKILDSYEELPAVDESLERLSDATYKASSYTNFMNAGDSKLNVPMTKGEEKIKKVYSRTPSWMLCDKAAESALNDALSYEMHPEKARKVRSRRTRMNRSRYKWKKALIHPVVEGSRKEMVGVMVWGQNGPEYYCKLTNKRSCIPFRKSRSFPEDPAKSSDISFNFEPKGLYFAASEPERKPRSEPKTPEEENKIEEKISKFDKNLQELVNRSNEKFFRSLSKEQSQGDTRANQNEPPKQVQEKEIAEEEKKEKSPPLQLMPRELLSSRAPKSSIKMERAGRDIFAFNVESKILAETLNERAKQFRLSQLSEKEDKLGDLEKKFPPKELDKEIKDANLSLWGMKWNEAELKELREKPEVGGEVDGNDLSLRLRIPLRLTAESNDCEHQREKNEVAEKNEKETTESAMEKLSDEMHRERREKYYDRMYKEGEQNKPAQAGSTGKKEEMDGPQSPRSEKLKARPEHEKILFDIFKNLVKDGCAISEKEFENLQTKLEKLPCETELIGCDESPTSDVDSKSSDESIPKKEPSSNGKKGKETAKTRSKKHMEHGDDCQSDGISKKFLKLKSAKEEQLERKAWKKLQKDLKGKKRNLNAEKMRMKLIREALPSMAAENEAAHLKQLKKYIHRFIDGVELKISSSPETRKRSGAKTRDTTSSESSEVRVDARKVIDLVSNPFKRITSDVTIDMAKKLTDALVQETCSKGPKNFPSSSKARKNSNETGEASLPCPTTSGSDREDEAEPTYMEGLKKMRNDHIVNIMMEVRRLKEVIRFLDRCNRLKL